MVSVALSKEIAMRILKFAVLALAFSCGASNAQSIRLYGDKPLVYPDTNFRIRPYVAPLSERVEPFEKGNTSLNPHGSWRNRLIFGAQSSSGSGAGEVDSKAGIVWNGKQQLQFDLKANLF